MGGSFQRFCISRDSAPRRQPRSGRTPSREWSGKKAGAPGQVHPCGGGRVPAKSAPRSRVRMLSSRLATALLAVNLLVLGFAVRRATPASPRSGPPRPVSQWPPSFRSRVRWSISSTGRGRSVRAARLHPAGRRAGARAGPRGGGGPHDPPAGGGALLLLRPHRRRAEGAGIAGPAQGRAVASASTAGFPGRSSAPSSSPSSSCSDGSPYRQYRAVSAIGPRIANSWKR